MAMLSLYHEEEMVIMYWDGKNKKCYSQVSTLSIKLDFNCLY